MIWLQRGKSRVGAIVLLGVVATTLTSCKPEARRRTATSKSMTNGGTAYDGGINGRRRPTDVEAVDSLLEQGGAKVRNAIVMSPREQLGGHVANMHLAPESSAARWVAASEMHREDAVIKLLEMAWDVLRHRSPYAQSLAESDRLLQRIRVRTSHLRGRPPLVSVRALQLQVEEALAAIGLPKCRLKLSLALGGAGAGCTNHPLDFGTVHAPGGAPTESSTMTLRDALGSDWRYLSPNAIEIDCPESWLAGPVRTVTAEFGASVRVRADIRELIKSPIDKRATCQRISWRAERPMLPIAGVMTGLRRATTPKATLESLTISSAGTGWVYVAKMCVGEEPARKDGIAVRVGGFWNGSLWILEMESNLRTRGSADLVTGLDLNEARASALKVGRRWLSDSTLKVGQMDIVRDSAGAWFYVVWLHSEAEWEDRRGVPLGVRMTGDIVKPSRAE